MEGLPYRTNMTWLSEDDLIILDVMFDGGVPFRLLRQENFQDQWNLTYSHNLADDELRWRLRRLCEQDVIGTERYENDMFFCMTSIGGDLWSQERCPVWERFCSDRYRTTSQDRTMMSVVAVSAKIRDDFLGLWPMYPSRRRTATIGDYGVIPWRSFHQLHVGVATYVEEHEWSRDEFEVWIHRDREHETLLERERSWWRDVSELQRFVPHIATNDRDRGPGCPGAPPTPREHAGPH